jgi:hypothetical protein
MKKTLFFMTMSLLIASYSFAAPGASDLHIYKGNNIPYYRAQLFQSNTITANGPDIPIDLTGSTVTAYMVDSATLKTKIKGATCTVIDAVNGRVEYQWNVNDTNENGTYWIVFKVTNGLQILTLPSAFKARVIIDSLN